MPAPQVPSPSSLQPVQSRWQETLSLLALAFRSRRSRPDLVYNLLGTHNNLAEDSLFLNLGYWREAKTYDAACTALAAELAKESRLRDGESVLDAGCGFGDAAAHWSSQYQLARLTALNITASQVEVARQRWADKAVDFVEGSALDMPFADASYDVILCLESTFHFPDRERFYREAYRVLKPGGRLAIADLFPLNVKISLSQRIQEWIGRGIWQIPEANWVGLEVSQKQLKALGFREIILRDISEFVFKPFKAFARNRVKDPAVASRLNPLLRKVWGGPTQGLQRSQYVIYVVQKPA